MTIHLTTLATRLVATTAVGILAASLALPALANSSTAKNCAMTLAPPSQAIFKAAAPSVSKGVPIRQALQSSTRGLVMSGQLPPAMAKQAAIGAVPCLRLLQH